MFFSTAALLALVPAALGHGIITTPPSRAFGNAMTSACGASLVTAVKQDNTSYVEQLTKLSTTEKAYSAANCNLWLCKGLQFADVPTANVQTWKAGDVVPIKIWLRIPHEGIANVSIVDTKTNKIVGDMLKVWDKGYAPGRTEKDVPVEQKEFSITVPKGLEAKCANAGDCVSSSFMPSRWLKMLTCENRSFSGGG